MGSRSSSAAHWRAPSYSQRLVLTHGGEGQQVVVQLPPLCGELQRPLQVSAPQPQVHRRVQVARLQVGLL